jgi:aspartyl-tRNA(Asn)/glutamyl-tRNA(Gln) amidotransferase subunit B
MEKGHLRCDANISIVKSDLPADAAHQALQAGKGKVKSENKIQRMSEIVEIKNINSFKFVEKALTYEERRLIDKYPDWPKKMKKVTHGFDSKTGTTFSLREKEEAKDYRYFPEPDLPPFEFSNKEIELIKKDLPILPSHGRQRYLGLGISEDQAKAIFGNSEWRILFDRLLELEPMFAPNFARLIINEPLSRDKPPEFIFSLVKMIKEKSLTSNIVRDILSSGDLKKATGGVVNADELVLQIVRLNPDVCAKYLSGKTQVLGFLVGQVMESSQGGLDAAKVRNQIIKMIEENQDGK